MSQSLEMGMKLVGVDFDGVDKKLLCVNKLF